MYTRHVVPTSRVVALTTLTMASPSDTASSRVLDTLLHVDPSMSREQRIQALLASATAALPPLAAVSALSSPHAAHVSAVDTPPQQLQKAALRVYHPVQEPLTPLTGMALQHDPEQAAGEQPRHRVSSGGTSGRRTSSTAITELLSHGGTSSDVALHRAAQQRKQLAVAAHEFATKRDTARAETEKQRHGLAAERATVHSALAALQEEQRFVEAQRAQLEQDRAALAAERGVLEATHAQLDALSAATQSGIEHAQRLRAEALALRAAHDVDVANFSASRQSLDALLAQARAEIAAASEASAVASRERKALEMAASAAEAKMSAAQRAADDVMRFREMVAASAQHLAAAWREFESAAQEQIAANGGGGDNNYVGGQRRSSGGAAQDARQPRASAAAARLSEALQRVSIPESVSAVPQPVQAIPQRRDSHVDRSDARVSFSDDGMAHATMRASLARLESDRAERLQAMHSQADALTSALNHATGVVAALGRSGQMLRNSEGEPPLSSPQGASSASQAAVAAATAAAAQARQHAAFVRRISESAAEQVGAGARHSTGTLTGWHL
jgi:trimeric autotransporter adhesin